MNTQAKQKTDKSKDLLGYVFSYKSSNTHNATKKDSVCYTISFCHGVSFASEGYPKKFKNERDFACTPIYAGDICPLYATKEEFLEVVKIHHNRFMSQDRTYLESLHRERKYTYRQQMSFDCFMAYTAVRYACTDFAFGFMSVEVQWALDYLKSFFSFKDPQVYSQCIEDDAAEYERDIMKALA